MALNGSTVLLKVGANAVAEQRGLSFEQSNNLIECSAKGDAHEKYIYGRSSSSLSLESCYVPTDAALTALRDARKNKTTVSVIIQGDSGITGTATAVVESVSVDYPDDDVITASVELKLTGEFQ